jgi:hypothetical protein
MSEVTSVNGKTGAVVLKAADVEAVATSEVGQPSGVASLNGSGKLPEGQLPSSVVTDSRGSKAGDLLLFNGTSFVRLPAGEPGEEMTIRSDGTVAYTPTRKVYLSAWTKKGPTEDCHAEFQTAAEKAMELGAELILPKECTLTGEVAIVNNTSLRLRICGAGAAQSTVVDKCTTGPCIRYERTDGKQAGFSFSSFTFNLECAKPEHNMVELVGLSTANFRVDEVWWIGKTGTGHRCRSGIFMKNLWEGSFNNCRWSELLGHEVWYENPSLNGGNVAFNDCQGENCQGGTVVLGSDTTNNVQFKNRKWVAQNGKEFYEKLTTGLPKIGAKEITLPKEINKSAIYLEVGRAVVLASGAGVDILHVNTYNEATGVLAFQDEVTKEHAAHADMRVLCMSNWSVITSFICPSMEFLNCHMEQCPAFISEAPGLTVRGHQTSARHVSYTGEQHIFYLAGSKTYDVKFTNLRLSVLESTKNAAVCPLSIEGLGTPAFEIDGVNAYLNNPSMTNEEYRPFWSPDAVFQSTTAYPANIKVKTKVGGVERDSTVGGFHGMIVVTESNAAWPIPPGAQTAEIVVIGGGGGGGGGGSASSAKAQVGGSAGSAGVWQSMVVNVSALSTLKITIGAGGKGGKGGVSGGNAGETGESGGATTVEGAGFKIVGQQGGHGTGGGANSEAEVKSVGFGETANALTSNATVGTGGSATSTTGGRPGAPFGYTGCGGSGGGPASTTKGGKGGGAGSRETIPASVGAGEEAGTGGGEGASAATNSCSGGGGGGGGAYNGGTGSGAGGNGGAGGSGYVLVKI